MILRENWQKLPPPKARALIVSTNVLLTHQKSCSIIYDMSKLKQPLLSLDAKGTLGGALTFQRSRSPGIVRTKPVPAYTRTLAQQYQRWDYQDAGYYWQTLTQTQKDAYRSYASRYHVPLYAAFLHDYLNNLPDLAGRWRLDTPVEATTPDSSKNTNTGTVFGATAAEGAIEGAFAFDGINDYVAVPDDPSLLITDQMTIEFFVTRYPTVGPNPAFVCHWASWLFVDSLPAQVPFFRVYTDIGNAQRTAPSALTPGLRTHLTATYNKSPPGIHLFKDGVNWDGALPAWSYGTLTPAGQSLYIAYQIGANFLSSIIDHVALYNRVLSDPQILAHSLRRYPS